MSQHDFDIANQGFPATRADINNAFQAIASNSSGPTAPSTTYANMWWYDTTNDKMYLRNEADSAWIEVATIDQTNNEWQITTGQISAVDGDGLVFKTDDGITRMEIQDDGDVAFDTDTLFIDASNDNIGIGTTSPDNVGSTNSLTINKASGNGQLSLMGNGTVYGRIFADNATGDLKMGNPTSNDVMFYTANVERMRILAGGGVTFNGDTAAGNALDDYEEGSWTPTVTGSGGNPTITYNTQFGRYTKVGQQVTVWFSINFSSYSGGSGTAYVNSLPFTQNLDTVAPNAGLLVDNLAVDCRQVSIQGSGNVSFLTLIKNGGGTAAHAGMSVSDLTVTSQIRGVYSYYI